MKVRTARINCPLCDWFHEADGPNPQATDPRALAAVFGHGVFAAHAFESHARKIEEILSAHFKTHTTVEWLTTVTALRSEVAALKQDAKCVRTAIAEISRESIVGAAFAELGDSEHEWYDRGWTGCVRTLERLLPLHCYIDSAPIDAAIADKQEQP